MEIHTSHIAFCKLALKKENPRPNISSVYRKHNHYVATDNHRLHMAYTSNVAENDYFLSGIEETFPDYEHIIPSDNATHTSYITINKYFIRSLSGMLHMIKTYDDKNKRCKFVIEDGLLKLSFDSNYGTQASVHIKADKMYGCQSENLDPQRCINLSYLLDVVFFALRCKLFTVRMEYYASDKPVKFSFGSAYKAYIMLCK